MPGIQEVFVRLANEPAFADAVRAAPAAALRGYDLTDADLRRLDAAIGAARPADMPAALGVESTPPDQAT